MSTHYCDVAPNDPVHAEYHAKEYGWPETDEARLFERLILEINQAGLNWALILKKRDGFKDAYSAYDIEKIAAYGEADRERLLADERIIRNKLKVNAVIHNAQVVLSFRESHGGFANWIAAHHPLTKPDWVKLFKKTFKFTGGEITGEFLMSIGYLPGTHRDDCPIYKRIAKQKPAWMEAGLPFYS